jgi:hypothetical protein
MRQEVIARLSYTEIDILLGDTRPNVTQKPDLTGTCQTYQGRSCLNRTERTRDAIILYVKGPSIAAGISLCGTKAIDLS